jgi:GT2 family glycosyltransferase
MGEIVIVISYSRRHFDPLNVDLYFGSAGYIARQIYLAAIHKVGEGHVLYIDANDASSWNRPSEKVELLITIEANAYVADKFYAPSRTLLVAVNHHPSSRRDIESAARLLGVPSAALDVTDGFLASGQGVSVADKIMLIGDFNSLSTYLLNGSKLRDIFPVAYLPEYQEWQTKNHGNDILCHIGSIGFRKGADVIFDLVKHLSAIDSPRMVHITGFPVNEYWRYELENVVSDYPENIKYHGWIDPKGPQFSDLLNSCSVGLFPTREEGLSGAYLEVASSGLPVITTKFVGIETAQELTLQDIGLEHVLRILHSDDHEVENHLQDVGKKTSELYRTMLSVNSQIYQTISRYIVSKEIWPNANIVLAVHNKEKTLKKLLSLLSDAAEVIDNVSLSLINDGSTDRSDKVISSFLRRKRTKRVFKKVKFLTTPDIFEVKSNNLGMKQFDSSYQIIVQDDNFLLNRALLAEMIAFADKYPDIAALGGMAGVNFYPIVEKCDDHFPGQHAVSPLEHYWRQDEQTNPNLKYRYFGVDAVMRGPLLFSGRAIRKIGLLDENYAPLYSDDMSWCFKARSEGYKVMAMLGDVYNNSQTMTTSNEIQNGIYLEAYNKNTRSFYQEWTPSISKEYASWVRPNWKLSNSRINGLTSLLKMPTSLHRKTLSAYVYLRYPQVSRFIRTVLSILRSMRP